MKTPFFLLAKADLLPRLQQELPQLWERNRKTLTEIERTFGSLDFLVPFYVVPDAQNLNPADLDEDNTGLVAKANVFDLLENFLTSSRHFSHAFLLSDAGMGKSSLLVILQLLHLAGLTNPQGPTELFKLGPDTLIDIESIETPADRILLLDALDEDREAWLSFYTRLQVLLQSTKMFKKVLITCRTQFFPHEYEADGRVPGQVDLSGFPCSKLFLSPFSNSQVDDYLKQRFRHDEERRKAWIIVDQMNSLKFRPMLLSYIELLMHQEGDLTYSYGIYEALVEEWLNRELRKGVVDDKDVLRAACKTIALYLYPRKMREVDADTVAELCLHIEGVRRLDQLSIEGRSLLHRTSIGTYKFAHYSILEFFVSASLLTKAENWPNTDQVVRFIGDLLVHRKKKKASKLGLNGLKASGVLDSVTFRGSELVGASFTKASLRGAIFKDSILINATFVDCDLEKANFEGSTVVPRLPHEARPRFQNCRMADTRMPRLDLTDTDVLSCSLVRADITGAVFAKARLDLSLFDDVVAPHTSFAGAILLKARLTNVELLNANFADAVLQETVISNSTLDGTSFAKAKIDRAVWKASSFNAADFTAASCKGAHFDDLFVNDARFDDARFELLDGTTVQLNDIKGENVSFARCNLTSANITRANLPRVTFAGATLEQVVFDRSILTDGIFPADCTSIRFGHSFLTRASFRKAKLAGAYFEHTDLAKADFTEADAPGAVFADTVLADTCFANANLASAKFVNSNISAVSFASTELSDTQFANCSIDNVDFARANLEGVDFGDCTLKSCKWHQIRFSRKTHWPENFQPPSNNVIGPGARLADQDLRNRKLDGAELHGADCRRTDFTAADLQGADLTDANLSEAILLGANLNKCTIEGAVFTGARYNKATKFPAQLNPVKARMKRVSDILGSR